MGRSQELYTRAKGLIPGGTHLLSKRPELFLPELWPAYYDRAKGCEIWDLDGRRYVDMITMGIGSCILGYADDDVNAAVTEAVRKGSMSSLNAPEEVELAELLCELHPWAQRVRFTRSGGEAMTVALRIARARARRDAVLFCGYHGWHDWYLAANLAEDTALDGHLLPGLAPRGVPRALAGSARPFGYNDTAGFVELADRHRDEVGVVVLEAVRNAEPTREFVDAIRRLTRERGIVFVVDEITSGWRLNTGGAHLLYDMDPDIAVFAKGISNGYPMGAVIGVGDVMDAAQETFVSSTYWTERIGPVAALACIRKMRSLRVPEHLVAVGRRAQEGWRAAAAAQGLPIQVSGIPPLAHFAFLHPEPLVLKTLFTQIMLEKGFLASTVLYASHAHRAEHLDGYLKAVDETFASIAAAVRGGDPLRHLAGPVCHAGFSRLT